MHARGGALLAVDEDLFDAGGQGHHDHGREAGGLCGLVGAEGAGAVVAGLGQPDRHARFVLVAPFDQAMEIFFVGRGLGGVGLGGVGVDRGGLGGLAAAVVVDAEDVDEVERTLAVGVVVVGEAVDSVELDAGPTAVSDLGRGVGRRMASAARPEHLHEVLVGADPRAPARVGQVGLVPDFIDVDAAGAVRLSGVLSSSAGWDVRPKRAAVWKQNSAKSFGSCGG